MLGFGGIAESAIAEVAATVGIRIIDAPVVFALAAGEDAVAGGAAADEGASEIELTPMLDPSGAGIWIVDQFLYVELIPAAEIAAAGARIADVDTAFSEVGPAVSEGAIGEEGPIAGFTQATRILTFASRDAAAGGGATTGTVIDVDMGSAADEIIARPRALRKIAIAS